MVPFNALTSLPGCIPDLCPVFTEQAGDPLRPCIEDERISWYLTEFMMPYILIRVPEPQNKPQQYTTK